MAIEGLSGCENKLYLSNDEHFKFQHIYFGDRDPMYQVIARIYRKFFKYIYNITLVKYIKIFRYAGCIMRQIIESRFP